MTVLIKSTQWITVGRVLLVLLAPLLIAAIAAGPISASGLDGVRSSKYMDSNQSFCVIERLAQRNPQWTVLGRNYHPKNPSWSLVLWCDGPRSPGEIDPDEILVLEHHSVSRSILATMRLRGAPPSAPMELGADTGQHFTRTLRGNLSFRSVVVGRTDQLEIIALVNQMLTEQVREVEQPEVSLTSSHF